MNEKFIKVFGLSRSGNHAIIEWILAHFKRHHFLDNVKLFSDVSYAYREEMYLPKLYPETDDLRYDNLDCVIFSYEDINLKFLREGVLTPNLCKYFYPFIKNIKILIIRDPYNLFASRIKCLAPFIGVNDEIVSLWKNYAREALGEQKFLEPDIVINFNRWYINEEYRCSISKLIGCNFFIKEWNHVPYYGGGSSFDARKFSGNAYKMNLFDRWKDTVENRQYLKYINDDELNNLAIKLDFGDIYENLFSRSSNRISI